MADEKVYNDACQAIQNKNYSLNGKFTSNTSAFFCQVGAPGAPGTGGYLWADTSNPSCIMWTDDTGTSSSLVGGGGGASLWEEGGATWIRPSGPCCNVCALCFDGGCAELNCVYSSTCIEGNRVTGATCISAPCACGTTSMRSPLVCGDTCVTSPAICTLKVCNAGSLYICAPSNSLRLRAEWVCGCAANDMYLCAGDYMCLCSVDRMRLCSSTDIYLWSNDSTVWIGSSGDGAWKSAAIEYEPSKTVYLKVDESPDVRFNDRGIDCTCDCCKWIEFDCIYSKVTESGKDYNAQITPHEMTLFSVSKEKGGFMVKTEKETSFDWSVSKLRKGAENSRWVSNRPFKCDSMNTYEVY